MRGLELWKGVRPIAYWERLGRKILAGEGEGLNCDRPMRVHRRAIGDVRRRRAGAGRSGGPTHRPFPWTTLSPNANRQLPNGARSIAF